jgi:hypothetical protein
MPRTSAPRGAVALARLRFCPCFLSLRTLSYYCRRRVPMASGMSPRVVLVVSESDICSVYNRCSEGKRVLRQNESCNHGTSQVPSYCWTRGRCFGWCELLARVAACNKMNKTSHTDRYTRILSFLHCETLSAVFPADNYGEKWVRVVGRVVG